MTSTENRRPLKTRQAGWAGRLATRAAAAGLSPDLISACSVVMAVLGGALLCVSASMGPAGRAICLVLAAACIQLRLLANMLDGMVAVENGKGSAYGPVWNELPDRFADALFLVGAGYAAMTVAPHLGPALGWGCTVLAVTTAYVRELGRSLGFPADFGGPMAKPHRMFALTVTCLFSAVEAAWGWRGEGFLIGLAVIAVGTLATVWRRTGRLGKALSARAADLPSAPS